MSTSNRIAPCPKYGFCVAIDTIRLMDQAEILLQNLYCFILLSHKKINYSCFPLINESMRKLDIQHHLFSCFIVKNQVVSPMMISSPHMQRPPSGGQMHSPQQIQQQQQQVQQPPPGYHYQKPGKNNIIIIMINTNHSNSLVFFEHC